MEQESTMHAVLNKLEIIKQTVSRIRTITNIEKKCGVLLQSIDEQLKYAVTQIKRSLGIIRHNANAKHEEHNYVVEFYDTKIRQLEKENRASQEKVKSLEQKNRQMMNQLKQFDSQVKKIRNQLIQKEQNMHYQRSSYHDNQAIQHQINELRSILNSRQAEITEIRRLLGIYESKKMELEKELKNEKSKHSVKILEINRCLDQTKADFLKLLKELERDNERLRKELKGAEERYVMRQYELKLKDKQFDHKAKQTTNLNDKIAELKQQVSHLQKLVDTKERQIGKVLETKKDADIELERLNQTIKINRNQIQWKLTKKQQEVELLEYENKKLHDLMTVNSAEASEKQRVIAVSKMRVDQLEKDKKMLSDEIQYKKLQVVDLVKKVEMLTKIREEETKIKEQSRQLLKQTYKRLETYELKFTELREEREKIKAKHLETMDIIKKEYERQIIELVRINKDFQNQAHKLEFEIKQLNLKLDAASIEIRELDKQKISLKQRNEQAKQQLSSSNLKIRELTHSLKENQQKFAKTSQQYKQYLDCKVQLSKINQQVISYKEEINNQKTKCKDLQKEINVLQQSKLKQIEQLRQRLTDDKFKLQEKYKRANQSASLKGLQLAAATTKAKQLEEEVASLKKYHTQEKLRLEIRVSELDKLLRERRDFHVRMDDLH